VEALSFPGIARHIKILDKAAHKRGGVLAIHTIGFNCNWLKAVVIKEVIVFCHFAASAFVAAQCLPI